MPSVQLTNATNTQLDSLSKRLEKSKQDIANAAIGYIAYLNIDPFDKKAGNASSLIKKTRDDLYKLIRSVEMNFPKETIEKIHRNIIYLDDHNKALRTETEAKLQKEMEKNREVWSSSGDILQKLANVIDERVKDKTKVLELMREHAPNFGGAMGGKTKEFEALYNAIVKL